MAKRTPLYDEWESKLERSYRKDFVPKPYLEDSETYHKDHFVDLIIPLNERTHTRITLSHDQAIIIANLIAEDVEFWKK